MKSNKKKRTKKKFVHDRQNLMIALIVLLILMVGIGYASLSRSLKITGKSTITGQTWDVHFDGSSIQSSKTSGVTVNTAPTVSDDSNGYKTQITYDVTLSEPGDYFEFTVDLLNAGSIAAKLSADPTITAVSELGDNVSNYFDYTVTDVTSSTAQTITKDNFSLASGSTSNPTTKKIKVRVEYKSDISDADLQTATKELGDLTFAMTFEQA